jgi:hypothetical protein
MAGHHENILFHSWKHLEAKGGATFACYALYQDETTHLSPQHVAREESRELLRGKSCDASSSANRFWTTYRNKESSLVHSFPNIPINWKPARVEIIVAVRQDGSEDPCIL